MDKVKLGQRIKKVRSAKGYTQLHTCDLFDTERRKIHSDNVLLDPKTLSRWENAHQQIEADNLQFLARALEVSYEEEIYWLGLSGYIAPTRMPTKDQIVSVLDLFYQDIEMYPFPALILDFRNNLWAINPAASAFVGSYNGAAEIMESKLVNLFEITFNSNLAFGNDLTGVDDFRRRQIVLFLITNLHRRHEPFWESYPECWKSELSPSDYSKFAAIWNEICLEYLDPLGTPQRFVHDVIRYSYVGFQPPTGSQIRFKVLAETPGYFYSNLFQVLRYTLVNEADRPEAERFFSQFSGNDTNKLMQWKLRDVNKILAEF